MKVIFFINILSVNLFIILSLILNEFITKNIFDYYPVVMVFLFFLNIICTSYYILRNKKISMLYLFYIIFLLLIIIGFLLQNPVNIIQSYDVIIYMVIWSIPAFNSGIYFSTRAEKKSLIKLFKVIYLVNSFILIFILIKYGYNIQNFIIYETELNMQVVTYISAFTVGLGLFYLYESNSFAQKGFIITVNLIIVVGAFLIGGRGGAILIVLYILLYYLLILIKNGVKFNFLLQVGLLIIATYNIFNSKIISDRTFSYLAEGGVDLSFSSGRDSLYEEAITLIMEKPLLGHGLFNYYNSLNGTPHNILLEMLLIFGMVGTIIFLSIFAYLILCFIKNYSFDKVDLLCVVVLIYPITYLNFSGNFLVVPELWFCLSYFINSYFIKSEMNASNDKKIYE